MISFSTPKMFSYCKATCPILSESYPISFLYKWFLPGVIKLASFFWGSNQQQMHSDSEGFPEKNSAICHSDSAWCGLVSYFMTLGTSFILARPKCAKSIHSMPTLEGARTVRGLCWMRSAVWESTDLDPQGSYKCLEMMVKGLVVGSLNTNWRAKETEWSEELPVFWWENCLQVIVRMWFNWRSWWNGGDLDDAVLGSWKRYPDLKLLETATCWTMSACTFVARIQICYSEDAGFFFFFSEQLPLRQEKQTLYIIVSTNGENYNWWKKSCTWNLQDPS